VTAQMAEQDVIRIEIEAALPLGHLRRHPTMEIVPL